LGVAAARAAIALTLLPVTGRVRLPLIEALGRVLALDVVAPFNVPAHDNAAMDGYAFSADALRAEAGGTLRLRVAERRLAGPPLAPHSAVIESRECVRIMTGALMPVGLDTVVPQEHCTREGDWVEFAADAVRAGANRRLAGEDLAAGRVALVAGRRLRPADLGLLASLGLGEVEVFRRLRVAVFSTGDELLSPGEPLAPGCLYDSNGASLGAAVVSLGCEWVGLGRVPDEPARLREVLANAVAQADVVLTSGGVSEGEADHTRQVLGEWGEVSLWKLAMRPGRPFAFACLKVPGESPQALARPVWLFGLPGNPVAALVAFYALVREALLHLSGASALPLPSLSARSALPLPKQPGRTEFLRGLVRPSAEGGWEVVPTPSQGSGVLRSMSEANALIVLSEDCGPVSAGELVPVWLFEGLA
jgi:molybdopterin molybdotransferase